MLGLGWHYFFTVMTTKYFPDAVSKFLDITCILPTWNLTLLFLKINSIGGTLITSRHVLSAAHCIWDQQLYLVRFGEYDLRTTKDGRHKDIHVSHAETHVKYNKLFHLHDIGIVFLKFDVKFNGKMRKRFIHLFI